jgi:hypothetical protein
MFGVKAKRKTAQPAQRKELKEALKTKLLQCGSYLNKRVQTLSIRKVRIALGVFVLLMSVVSFLSIWQAVKGETKHSILSPHPIQIPKYLWMDSVEQHKPYPITEKDYECLLAYQNFLDSLKKVHSVHTTVLHKPGQHYWIPYKP